MRKILLAVLLASLIIPMSSAQSRRTSAINRSPQGRTLTLKTESDGSNSKQDGKAVKPLHFATLNLKAASAPVRLNADETSILYKCSYTRTIRNKTTSYSWGATFVFNEKSKSVVIKNILDGMLGGTCNDVKGTYENNVITLSCKNFSKDSTNTVLLASDSEQGVDAFLGTGTYEADQGTILLDKSCKLYVSDKLDSITSKGKAIGIVYNDGKSIYFATAATAGLTYKKVPEGSATVLTPRKLDYPSIYYTQSKSMNLTLSSEGTKAVDYKISISDKHFSVADSLLTGTLSPLEIKTIPVVFNPTAAGDYTGIATITAADSVYKVSLKGTGKDIPSDFSSIITSGDKNLLKWDNASKNPWTLDKGVAYEGNAFAQDTLSALKATINSDKATRMTFDLNMKTYFESGDSILFTIDNHRVFAYSYKLADTESVIIPAGKHMLQWDFIKSMVSVSGKDTLSQANISNMKLESVPVWEGVSPDNSVSDFTANNFSNFTGTACPTDKNSSLEMKVNLTAKAGLSFDCAALKGEVVKVLVDGKEEMSIENADTTFFHNFTAAGAHTIKCVYTGSGNSNNVAISNVYLTKDAYKEVSRNYLLTGTSYFTMGGSFDANKGAQAAYTVNVKMTNTGKVVIKNLLNKGSWTKSFPIIGKIKDNTITILTNTNINKGTIYGYDDQTLKMVPVYYGNRYWLVAGTMTDEETKSYATELHFTMSADSTLKADNGIGIKTTFGAEGDDISAFMQPGAILTPEVDGYSLIATKDTVDFGNGFSGMSQITRSIAVLNNGKATDYSVDIKGGNGAFSVAPKIGNIASMSAQTFDLAFTPKATGSYEGKLIITSEGKDVAINLKGVANDKPDYSTIVTEGKELITWSSSADYPWYTKDGVAYSGNHGVNSSTSTLTANFTVPEGKVARLSANCVINVEPTKDNFLIKVNGIATLGSDIRNDYADFGHILEPGTYAVSFNHIKDADVLLPSNDICKLSNLKLELMDKAENLGIVLYPKRTFTELAPINGSKSIYAWVVNKGTKPLKINSFTADAPFIVEGYDKDIAAGDTAAIVITMKPTKVGSYDNNIVLHTTAGDLNIEAIGSSDYVRYLGTKDSYQDDSPFCSFYASYEVYPIYNECIYSADEMKGLENCKITDMTFFTTTLADVDFTAKDVEYKVSMTDKEDVSPNDPTDVEDAVSVYKGEQCDVSNYQMHVPFSTPFVYTGKNFMFMSRQNDYESFRYFTHFYGTEEKESGLPINSTWIQPFGQWQTLHIAPYLCLKYTPADGIQKPQTDGKTIVSVKYFTVCGMQIQQPQQGVNIVITTYDDGTATSTKQYVK